MTENRRRKDGTIEGFFIIVALTLSLIFALYLDTRGNEMLEEAIQFVFSCDTDTECEAQS